MVLGAPIHSEELAVVSPTPSPAVMLEAVAHVVALDGIRGLAILLVLLFHYANLFYTPGRSLIAKAGFSLLSAGWIGVDLFFVLSGFLITGILRQTRAKPLHFRNFFARRSLRIFPLYYAFLAIFFALTPFPDKVWYLTYLWNIRLGLDGWAHGGMLTHLWSLAVEEQFYLVWPVAVYVFGDKGLLRFCLGLLALGLGTRLLCFGLELPAAAYTLMPCHVDGLAAGALLTFFPKVLTHRQVKLILLSMAGLVAAAVAVAGMEHGFYNTNFATVTAGITCVNLAFAGLIALISRHASPLLTRIFSTKWVVWLGKYSYAIYLFHYPVACYLRSAVRNSETVDGLTAAGLCLATTIVTLGLAKLSWRLLESPCLQFKRYFI